MAGLDPFDGWERTPGELYEFIDAYLIRQERMAYMLYDLAGAVANLTMGKRKLPPEKLFNGFITKTRKNRQQSAQEMSAIMDLWGRAEVRKK